MIKKEKYNYFDEYILLSECIVKSAYILKDIMQNFDINKVDKDIEEVHSLENDADKIIHKMRNYLIKDFLPPIDREDIILIGSKLDDVEDGIDEVLINVKILNITKIREEVLELIDILVKCCNSIKETLLEFKDLKNIELVKQKVIEINALEDEGDRAYQELMTSIYKNEKEEPIELIKWTNIFNCLENTIDSCEQIGDCIGDVILKNS